MSVSYNQSTKMTILVYYLHSFKLFSGHILMFTIIFKKKTPQDHTILSIMQLAIVI